MKHMIICFFIFLVSVIVTSVTFTMVFFIEENDAISYVAAVSMLTTYLTHPSMIEILSFYLKTKNK